MIHLLRVNAKLIQAVFDKPQQQKQQHPLACCYAFKYMYRPPHHNIHTLTIEDTMTKSLLDSLYYFVHTFSTRMRKKKIRFFKFQKCFKVQQNCRRDNSRL